MGTNNNLYIIILLLIHHLIVLPLYCHYTDGDSIKETKNVLFKFVENFHFSLFFSRIF